MVVGSVMARGLSAGRRRSKAADGPFEPLNQDEADMGKGKKAAKTAAKADRDVTHEAARRDDGPVLRAAGKLTELADQPPLIALSAGTILVGLLSRRRPIARTGSRMLASHLLATAVKTVLKSSIDRTRPARALKHGYHAGKGDGADDPSLNSFPSGHTAGAVAVAQGVAAESRLAAIPLQLAAIGVGAMQPRRGKHYLSDVIVGAAIGFAAERLTNAVMERIDALLWKRSEIAAEQEVAAHPS